MSVAVVSIENEANWTFFLQLLLSNLEVCPAFLISDRDKGLVPAVTSLDNAPRHYYCFRHLVENFNKKFKSKDLKNSAWMLARARTESEFNKQAEILRKMNKGTETWLLDMGKEKWSLAFGSCPRYGTLTSNNVESINGVLRGIRKILIVDCLLAIERYIGVQWVSSLIEAQAWGSLTKWTSRRVEKALTLSNNIQVSRYSKHSFLVTTHLNPGELPKELAV
jgi:hypothetical protein